MSSFDLPTSAGRVTWCGASHRGDLDWNVLRIFFDANAGPINQRRGSSGSAAHE